MMLVEMAMIGGYRDQFAIDKQGVVYQLQGDEAIPMKLFINHNNKRLSVKLFGENCSVARLVLKSWKPNLQFTHKDIIYKDSNRKNCSLDNLKLQSGNW